MRNKGCYMIKEHPRGLTTFKLDLILRLKLFTTQSRLLTTLTQRPFENIMGKGENAGNQHFLLFS